MSGRTWPFRSFALVLVLRSACSERTASLRPPPAFPHAVESAAGNVVKSLERKVEEEAGRAAPRLNAQPDGRTSKPDTTVGVELGWLRDVRTCLVLPGLAHGPLKQHECDCYEVAA